MKHPGDRHLDDRDLLRCLDAEGPRPEHLDRCWTCRTRLRELEDLTGDIVRLRDDYLLAEIGGAPPFGRRLTQATAEASPPRPRRIHWPAIAGFAALLALMAVVWPSGRVSAHEALTRSADAERLLVANIGRPVVRQSLRVRRVAATGQTRETNYQSWVEWPSGRWRTSGGDPQLLLELETVCRANQLRPDLPLSAMAFSRWAAADTDLAYHNGVLKADRTTDSVRDSNDSVVMSAELRLRPSDWHVISEKLILASRTYEITETSLEVTAFTANHRQIFDQPTPGPALASRRTPPPPVAPIVAAVPSLIAPPTIPPTPATTPVDLDELEVEVWHAIHRGGCQRGCDLTITESPGNILVSGTTATRTQRDQLAAALRSIDPSARIIMKVRPLDTAIPTPLPPGQRTSIRATPLPIESFLSAQPAPSGQRVMVASLANQVISLADQAEQQAQALTRLAARFPAPRYRGLPARSRWLLDAMALEHLQSLRISVASLQAVQQPVFAQLPQAPQPASTEPQPPQHPLAAYATIHALLHGLYAGASDTAPLEAVREVATRLASLATALADEDLPENVFVGPTQPFRSPR